MKKLSTALLIACSMMSCQSDEGKKNTPPVAKVTIKGNPVVGGTLTADTTGSTDEDGDKVTFTYQWYRAEDNQGQGEAKINNAVTKTYTLAAEDAGKYIRVKVTPNDGKVDGEEVAAEYTEKTQVKNIPPAAKVTIKGNLVIGGTLTADTAGSIDADGDKVTFTYQWYRAEDKKGQGEAKIDNAKSKTYTLAAEDVDKDITVKVTPNDGKVDEKEVAAEYTEKIQVKNTPPAAKVTIKGNPVVGETLTADTNGSTDADGDKVTFSYQWYRAEDNQGQGEAKINNATSKTYTLAVADEGKYITVKVTPNDGKVDGKEAAAEYTEKIQAKNNPPTAKVTIKGNPVVGETLTADTTGSTDADGDKVTFKYQWYRLEYNQGQGETKISGAVNKTYTLAAKDAGKYITVKVTPSDGTDDGDEVKAGYTRQIATLLVEIPDFQFRRYLKRTIPYAFVGDKMNTDTVKNLKKIDVHGIYIRSLQGIEYFTGLTELNCNSNQLTSLDITHNTALTTLDCWNNQLTKLDVTHNNALTILWCSKNQLTSLDLTHNPALTELTCYTNKLNLLDVTHNTALTDLDCFKNKLTALDVTHNTALTKLWCSENQLTALDVTHNTTLTELDCFKNKLTALDVTQNTALTELWCSENQLTALDVTHNTALFDLRCSENQLTALDVTNNTALTKLDCYDNQIKSLDLSKNCYLNYSNVKAGPGYVHIKWCK